MTKGRYPENCKHTWWKVGCNGGACSGHGTGTHITYGRKIVIGKKGKEKKKRGQHASTGVTSPNKIENNIIKPNQKYSSFHSRDNFLRRFPVRAHRPASHCPQWPWPYQCIVAPTCVLFSPAPCKPVIHSWLTRCCLFPTSRQSRSAPITSFRILRRTAYPLLLCPISSLLREGLFQRLPYRSPG